jgi:hypothetical protein
VRAGSEGGGDALVVVGRFGEAFKPQGEEAFRKLQLKELKNGRLAMVSQALL